MLMWAVNEVDLSEQTISGYVHVVMLHYGLGVGLAVADLLPLLPPPVRHLRVLLALCPSLCLPKCPQQWMRRFHAQVKVLHTSLLNTTVVAFKVLPLGSYAPMPAPSPPFKIILELVLWNGLQRCRCIIPDIIIVIKMPSFQYFLYLREQKKITGG